MISRLESAFVVLGDYSPFVVLGVRLAFVVFGDSCRVAKDLGSFFDSVTFT